MAPNLFILLGNHKLWLLAFYLDLEPHIVVPNIDLDWEPQILVHNFFGARSSIDPAGQKKKVLDSNNLPSPALILERDNWK